jgi:hypothetical protein
MVRRLETPQQSLPDERGGKARPRGRAQGIRDFEGDDSISINRATVIGSCEATREGTYRRVTKEGKALAARSYTLEVQLECKLGEARSNHEAIKQSAT